MTIHKPNTVSRAFSLVEMLVVVAIIAILISILVPSFGAIRNNARKTATTATLGALDSGIAAYRAEQALGGSLPPSSSDWPTTNNAQQSGRNLIENPQKKRTGNTQPIRVAGAHLLVYAMIGADGLGTAGFRDVSQPRDGAWWNDMHDDQDGLYHVYADGSNAGKTQFQRYGGAGYVDEKLREKTTSIQEMYNEGKAVTDPSTLGEAAVDEPMFLDAWGLPILYYRSNPSSIFMTGDTNRNPKAGIYWQEDNAVITGSEDGALGLVKGVDFGAGADDDHPDQYHLIHSAKSPGTVQADYDQLVTEDGQFEHTFARYIFDPSIKARPTPVQKDHYLLISAGPDAIYGSQDDVTNFTRKTE